MKMRQINVTDPQDDVLKDKATELGIPVTELVRRIIDRWIEDLKKEKLK